MMVSTSWKGYLLIAAALATVSFAGGVLYLLGQFTVDASGTAMRIGVGVALIGSGVALSIGLWASRYSGKSSGSLMAAGALPAAVCFWWTGVVPAVALSVAAFGIFSARKRVRKAVSR